MESIYSLCIWLGVINERKKKVLYLYCTNIYCIYIYCTWVFGHGFNHPGAVLGLPVTPQLRTTQSRAINIFIRYTVLYANSTWGATLPLAVEVFGWFLHSEDSNRSDYCSFFWIFRTRSRRPRGKRASRWPWTAHNGAGIGVRHASEPIQVYIAILREAIFHIIVLHTWRRAPDWTASFQNRGEPFLRMAASLKGRERRRSERRRKLRRVWGDGRVIFVRLGKKSISVWEWVIRCWQCAQLLTSWKLQRIKSISLERRIFH